MQAEHNQLTSQLEKSQNDNTILKKDYDDLKKKLQSAEHSLNSHNSVVREYEDKIAKILKEKEQMSIQLDNKSQEIEKLSLDVKKLKSEVTQADQVNDNLRAKMMDKELEVESLQVNFNTFIGSGCTKYAGHAGHVQRILKMSSVEV